VRPYIFMHTSLNAHRGSQCGERALDRAIAGGDTAFCWRSPSRARRSYARVDAIDGTGVRSRGQSYRSEPPRQHNSRPIPRLHRLQAGVLPPLVALSFAGNSQAREDAACSLGNLLEVDTNAAALFQVPLSHTDVSLFHSYTR
jgi:hypothetical protein